MLFEEPLDTQLHGQQADRAVDAGAQHFEMDNPLLIDFQHLYIAAVFLEVAAIFVEDS